MWLSDLKNTSLALAAFVLASCGFAPAYGPQGPALTLRDNVALSAPGDRDGFDLTTRLEERLGRASGAPDWRLDWSLSINSREAGLLPDGAITRYTLVGKAHYSLVSNTTGQVATSGSVANQTTYSSAGSTAATSAAERDAHMRLMMILADQMVNRLIAASPRLP